MNPYARFGLVSNSVSAALLVTGLALFGAPVFEAITTAAGGSGPAMWGALGGAVAVLVVFWLAMTEAIFPTLFRFNTIRKMVLGKYYIEGTWLQAERGQDSPRMAVIDIQPSGNSFIFSGYALNEELEIESNTLIEFSKFEWPFMTYKYRNSLSDGADGQREGVGEIQFEMNRSAARRYNGFAQFVKNGARLKIEGNKLTSGREVRELRSLAGRQKIFQKYWELFFNSRVSTASNATAASAAPVIPAISAIKPVIEEAVPQTLSKAAEPFVERRTGQAPTADGPIIPRRRATDWRQDVEDDATMQEDETTDTEETVAATGSDDATPAPAGVRRSYRSRSSRY